MKLSDILDQATVIPEPPEPLVKKTIPKPEASAGIILPEAFKLITSETNSPILVVDGSHMLHRVKYSAFVHAGNAYAYLFMKILLGSFSEISCYFTTPLIIPQVFVLWDKGRSKYRSELFPGYKVRDKTDSPEMVKAYQESRNILHTWLPKLGISSILVPDYEADDFAYLITKQCEESGQTYITITEDNDWQAFLRPGSYMFKPRKKELITWDAFMIAYGPDKPLEVFRTIKALIGDTSDTIPGVKGVGEKRGPDLAKAIVNDRSIEYLKGAKQFMEQRDVFDRNYKLVGFDFIDNDSYVEQVITDARDNCQVPDGDVWINFCEKIESDALLSEYYTLTRFLVFASTAGLQSDNPSEDS